MGAVALTAAGMFMQAGAAKKGAKAQQQANALAAQQAEAQLEFQKEQMALLEQQKQRYRDFEFKNPYEGMQNVFEDLTVNQEAARFHAERGAQPRANIMQTMQRLSLIHICRCSRLLTCSSRWSPNL